MASLAIGRFLDRLALGGNARQLGYEDAEAAFGAPAAG